MAEKRRGLGRGLGALIPSAPVEEATPEVATRRSTGRPADLFFESGTGAANSAEEARSASRGGINKDALVAPARRKTSKAPSSRTAPNSRDAEAGRDQNGAASAPKGKRKTSETPAKPKTVSRETAQATELAPAEHKAPEARVGATDDVQPALTHNVGGQLHAVGARGNDSEMAPTAAAAAASSAPGADKLSGQAPTEDIRPGDTEGARESGVVPAVEAPEEEANPSNAGIPSDGKRSTVEESDPGSDLPPEPAALAPETAAVSRETGQATPASNGSGGTELVEVPGARFAELPIDAIHANRKQPRSVFDADEMAELVHSIREIGVLQPIVVRPSPEEGGAPYELVMGERRWRATREAGLAAVPAIIRSTADDDLLRDALLENLHRSSLNPLEEAAAYQQLLEDFGCSHEELAERIGRSRPQISNTLRLMKLPPLVQRRVAAGVLSAGHARALLALSDPAEMEKLAQRIVAEGLSVRSTEEIVSMSDGLRRAAKPASPRNPARHERLDYLATSLSDRLDTNVKITLGARKGKVSIEFASVDDLNRIMSVLSPGQS